MLYVYLVVVVVLIAIHVSKYLLCIKDVNLRDIDLYLFVAIYFEKAHFIILAHAMYFLLFTFTYLNFISYDNFISYCTFFFTNVPMYLFIVTNVSYYDYYIFELI